jgi:uncharacterized protein YccT (UPF0319 family)
MNVSVSNSLKAVLLGLAFFTLTACSTNKLVKTYEGDVLPQEQVSILAAPENLSVLSVNGRGVPVYMLSDVETRYALKPGMNQVVFKYESVWAKPGPKANGSARSERIESLPMLVNIDAQAGEQYRFVFDNAGNIREARALSQEFFATVASASGAVLSESALYKEGVLANKELPDEGGRTVESEEPSQIESLMKLWEKTSPKERKAFLVWAIQE